MASKQVKNKIMSQMDSVIARVKKQAKIEKKKLIQKAKSKIPTPEVIAKKLLIELSPESCSEAGNQKFTKKLNKFKDQFSRLENVVNGGIEKIDEFNEKLQPISLGEGPTEALKNISELLEKTLIPLLKASEIIAKANLLANSGPASSGAITKLASDKIDLAISKQKEFGGLISSIPLQIEYYQQKALDTLNPIQKIKSELTIVKNEIQKIRLYVNSFELQYMEGCTKLNNADNLALGSENNSHVNNSENTFANSPLDLYLQLLQSQYNDTWKLIQETGGGKFVKRMYALKEDLTEDYNISHEVKNIHPIGPSGNLIIRD